MLTPQENFEKNLDQIQDLIARLCRRQHMSEEESEDFSSSAMVKLIQDDYAVFRNYQGRASLNGYLRVVLHSHLLNWRDKQWGKWRPSARAMQLGATAILLERLCHRDGYSFKEAVSMMTINCGLNQTEKELEALASLLPDRLPRILVGDESLAMVKDQGTDPETITLQKENSQKSNSTSQILSAEIAAMEQEDRLLLRLYHHDQIKVSVLARMLGLDQKNLYRRLEQLAKGLRRCLEDQGIGHQDVIEVLDCGGYFLKIEFEPEKTGSGLSISHEVV